LRKSDLKDYLFAFLNDEITKKPPAGLGHIISTHDLADDNMDHVDELMKADKAKVSDAATAAELEAEKKAEARRKKRLEIERQRAAKKKELEELKAKRDRSMRLIQRGAWFMKHGRRGYPKQKYVVVQKDPSNRDELVIVWKTHKSDTPKRKREYPFKSIQGVVSGKSAGLLKALDEDDVEGAKSMTLVLNDKDKPSLDLTAKTVSQRDDWVQAFQVILSYEKRRSSIAAQGKELYNLTMADKKNLTRQPDALDKLEMQKRAAQEAQDALRLRQQKMREAEMASQRLADSAGDFEAAAKRVKDQQNSSMFGMMATAVYGDD